MNNELIAKEKELLKIKTIKTFSIPIEILLVFLVFIGVIVSTSKSGINTGFFVALLLIPAILFYPIVNSIYKKKYDDLYNSLEENILHSLGLSGWMFDNDRDDTVVLKSSQSVNKFDDIKYFKENEGKLAIAIDLMNKKQEYANLLREFLNDNEYKLFSMYDQFERNIRRNLSYTDSYYIEALYVSPTGRSSKSNTIEVSYNRLKELESDKSLLMSKGEYSRYVKEQERNNLEEKQHIHYEIINRIIDLANSNRESLVIKSDIDELDKLISSLFEKTVNSIKKIKTTTSEEWDVIDRFISNIDENVNKIIAKNTQIIHYYESEDFATIKKTCDSLMESQREFNEYIEEKAQSISNLFGTNIIREETSFDDEFNYIHPYKKSLTPFTAEVSATVFSSAENNPLDYIVKYFYPNKNRYPDQIQKLHLLIEELETLKEAKSIIDTYKQDIQQYISDVPSFVMEYDEDGFYSRLGFATVNESVLEIAYKFSYTSNGGKAQRSFTVPMTEDTIVNLIQLLESKLTMSAFSKEQRSLMTSKLRQQIKERDNYTCRYCGNSTHKEPNLLLEIDHIIPVAKGGYTEESNLQTLCWKCNRQKSDKIVS